MSLRDYLFYEEPGITLYCGDCRDVLPLCDYDSILTDPPYGKGQKYGGQIADSLANFRTTVEWVVSLAKPTALTVPVLRLWDIPKPQWVGVWHKPQTFGFWMTPLYPHWEPIVFYGLVGKAGEPDVWTANPQAPNGHPTPKPLRLWTRLVSVLPGVIADPFVGSGTTLEAAKKLGRSAIGIEIEPKYCKIAVKRLRQEVLAL